MKLKPFALAAGLLCGTIFSDAARADAPAPRPAFGLEHGDQIKADVRALVDFMVNRFLPFYEGLPYEGADFEQERARERLKFTMFKKLLDGCHGEPGLADYAWTANQMVSHNWTGLELAMVDHFAGMLPFAVNLHEDFRQARENVKRWVWELNDAYFKEHPEIQERLAALQMAGALPSLYSQEEAGLTIFDEFSAPVVFGVNSRFAMTDPAYSMQIHSMHNTPPELYRSKRSAYQLDGDSPEFEPRPYGSFNHELACQ